MPVALVPARPPCRSAGPLVAGIGALVLASSCLVDATDAERDPAASPPRLAIVDATGPRLVLSDDPSDALPAGPPELVRAQEDAEDATVLLRRTVPLGALGPDATTWLGARVRLHGVAGVACEGVVDDVHLEAEVSASALASDDDRDPAALWDLAESHGRVALVAAVRTDDDCAGAVWGRLAGAPAAIVHGPRPASDAEHRRALAAFRELPAWRAIAKRATGADRLPVPWDEADAGPAVRVFPEREDGTGALVVVTAIVDRCDPDLPDQAPFEGRLSAVFRDDGERATLASTSTAFVPFVAVDTDGDGLLDLVEPGAFRRGAALDVVSSAAIPFFGDPCHPVPPPPACER